MSISVNIAKGRLRAARILGRLLLGKVSGDMPSNNIGSLEEALWQRDVSKHVAGFVTILGPSIERYDFPENYPPQFRRGKAFEKKLLFELRDVCVSPQSGLVWLPEGFIVQESVGSLFRLMGWGNLLHEPIGSIRRSQVKEPVVVSPPTGYFHWLLEIMPNVLHTLSIVPEVKVALPVDSPKYVLDAFKTLFGSADLSEKIVLFDGPLRVSKLIMPQVPPHSGFVPEGDVEKLRNSFKSKVALGSSSVKERVYISRTASPKRRFGNEQEFQKALEGLAFKVVHCEDMGFGDQISLFSRAEFIVGPHGAGLSNMIWSEPPCRILEIFPTDVFNDCYARLAASLGFQYDYFLCEDHDTRSGHIPIAAVLDKVGSARI